MKRFSASPAARHSAGAATSKRGGMSRKRRSQRQKTSGGGWILIARVAFALLLVLTILAMTSESQVPWLAYLDLGGAWSGVILTVMFRR